MNRTLQFACLSSLLLSSVGCTTVRYEGEVHPPVADSIVVQSKDQLSGSYEPVGRAIASVPAGYSGADLRKALELKAEAVGAHAVVLGNYKYVKTGSHLDWSYEPYVGPYDRWHDTGIHGPWGGTAFSHNWYHRTVHYEFALQLKALFLRRTEAKTRTK